MNFLQNKSNESKMLRNIKFTKYLIGTCLLLSVTINICHSQSYHKRRDVDGQTSSSAFIFPDEVYSSHRYREHRFTSPVHNVDSKSNTANVGSGPSLFSDLPVRTKKARRNRAEVRPEYIGRMPVSEGRSLHDHFTDVVINEDELLPPPHGPVRPPVQPYSLSWVREGRMRSGELTDKIQQREDKGNELLTAVTEFGINETNYLIRVHEPKLYSGGEFY